MAEQRSNRRRKKIRYKNLSFKLSADEYAQLIRYCRKHKLTPNKLIKKSLRIYVKQIGPLTDPVITPVSKNQLTIFDLGATDSVIIAKTPQNQ